jgi:hypothetical protein
MQITQFLGPRTCIVRLPVESFITFELCTFEIKYDNLTGYHLTIISGLLQAGIAHFLLLKYLPQRDHP